MVKKDMEIPPNCKIQKKRNNHPHRVKIKKSEKISK